MAKPAAAYPFVTRKQIVARLEAQLAFVNECAAIMQARTEQRAAGNAPAGKPWGWMSSERVVAGRLTAKSRIGMLSEEEESTLGRLVSRYSRQLADHFRAIALAENPALSVAAEKFGVGRTGSNPSDISRSTRESTEIPSQCPPADDHQPDDLEGDLDADSETAQEDQLPRRLMECVERTPGQRTDAIAKALDTTTAMIAPALRMLVQGKRLKKRGVGRGTRYFVR
jgi:hypothetical protein